MLIDILKTHGSSNDILVIEGRPSQFENPSVHEFVAALCDRKGPFGGDGVYFVDDTVSPPEAFFFNSDGSAGKFCGNGLRTVARWVLDRKEAEEIAIRIGDFSFQVENRPESKNGVRQTRLTLPPISFRVADLPMTWPEDTCIAQRIPQLHDELTFTALAVPNPHLVAITSSYSRDELVRLGERMVRSTGLLPDGANVSLVQPIGPDEFFGATFERGAGLTLSCGSGVVASRAAYSRLGYCNPQDAVTIHNPGGDAISTIDVSTGQWIPTLSGNASYVYRTAVDPATFVAAPGSYGIETYADEITAFTNDLSINEARLAEVGIRLQ